MYSRKRQDFEYFEAGITRTDSFEPTYSEADYLMIDQTYNSQET